MLLTNPYLPDPRVHKEATYLIENGHQVTVLALDYRNRRREHPVEVLDGVEVRRFFTSPDTVGADPASWTPLTKLLNRIPFFWHFESLRHQLRFIRQLKDYFAQHHTDYLHGHDLSGAWIATRLKLKDVPIVFDMHEEYLRATPKKARFAPLIGLFYRHIQDKVDHLVYIHEAQIKDVAPRNRDKLVFLPNYPLATTNKIFEHRSAPKLRIAYIGSLLLETYELHRNVFEATRDLDVEVRVYGRGFPGFPLSDIAEGYSHVRLMGAYNYQADLPKIYQETDITYFLYDYRNLGYRWAMATKLYEAMCFWTPFIVEDRTGMADFARTEGVGFPVDTYDVVALRTLFTRLVDDPNLIRAAREKITERDFATVFTWERVASNLLNIYGKGTA
jgi:glycosyltransferase involved in cell wall biosynthesis